MKDKTFYLSYITLLLLLEYKCLLLLNILFRNRMYYNNKGYLRLLIIQFTSYIFNLIF